jgi:hypothetical protein
MIRMDRSQNGHKTVAAVESVLGDGLSLAEAFPDPVDEIGNSLLDGKTKLRSRVVPVKL